jgi:hypothetical protein
VSNYQIEDKSKNDFELDVEEEGAEDDVTESKAISVTNESLSLGDVFSSALATPKDGKSPMTKENL